MQKKLSVLISAALLTTTFATKSLAKDEGFYVGFEGGLSAPLVTKFKEKIEANGTTLNATGKLGKSPMYGALLGYKFYPGMALEFSWQKKPKYKLNIAIPPQSLAPAMPGLSLAKFSNDVKVSSELFLLGIVYDLEKVKNFTPYVGVEFGIANIKAKQTSFYSSAIIDATNTVLPGSYSEVMRVKKSSSISPAFQLSIGMTSPEIIPNMHFYAAVRGQLIFNAKLKYDLIDPLTKEISARKFKKSLAIGEIVGGLTYDLPF